MGDYRLGEGWLYFSLSSAGNTTFFLYGRGPIGEKTTTWNYSLLDGTNTPRQLTATNGDVTLSTRYTPWGDTLELNGTGNPSTSLRAGFTFGYPSTVAQGATLRAGIGGILDVAPGPLGACPELVVEPVETLPKGWQWTIRSLP